MKKIMLAALAVFSLYTCTWNHLAKERRGADVVVEKKGGQKIKGELIAVKQDSLLLLDSTSGSDESIHIQDIRLVRIVRKTNITKGAGYGLLASFIYAVLASESHQVGEILGLTLVVGIVYCFIPIGALIGLLAGQDEVFGIEGRSPSEISDIMKKLSGKARIRKIQ